MASRRTVRGDAEGNLAASAVSAQAPPAGPQWLSGLVPLEPHTLAYGKLLCASLDGFTLHGATRAGAQHPSGREALLRYVLRPPIAQEHLAPRDDGLLRIMLKKPYADGTFAVPMDPLSLLCRLAASVPAPRFQSPPRRAPRSYPPYGRGATSVRKRRMVVPTGDVCLAGAVEASQIHRRARNHATIPPAIPADTPQKIQ
jgi:Putative transposase